MRGCLSRQCYAALTLIAAEGCNVVLGIDEPHDRTSALSETGGTASTGGSNLFDTPPDGGEGSSGGVDANDPLGDGESTTEAPDSEPVAQLAPVNSWAGWVMPNPPGAGLPNPQSYDVKSSRGVVIDKVTHLQWQQAVDATLRDQPTAMSYCDSLDLAGTGWRLPSRIELLSIVDYTAINPWLNATVFSNTQPDYYWTASPVASQPLWAWAVDFGFTDGIPFTMIKTTEHFVRCVR